MPNPRTFIFVILAVLAFLTLRFYQQYLSGEIVLKSEALAKENKLYYAQLSRKCEEFNARLKMKTSYQDSFSFIKTLFDISIMDTYSIYEQHEINDLLTLVSENTSLKKMRAHSYNSSLEIYDEAFRIVLKLIDSLSTSGYEREPVLIVEKVKAEGDSCHIKMIPIHSFQFHNDFEIWDGQKLVDVTSLPFVYPGDPRNLSIHFTHDFVYEYK